MNAFIEGLKEIPNKNKSSIFESRIFLEDVITSLYLSRGQIVTEQDFKDLKDTLIEIGGNKYSDTEMKSNDSRERELAIEKKFFEKIMDSDIGIGTNLINNLTGDPEIAKIALEQMFARGEKNWAPEWYDSSENGWGLEWLNKSKSKRMEMTSIINQLKEIPPMDNSQPMGEQAFYESVVSCLAKTEGKHFTSDGFKYLKETLLDIGCKDYKEWAEEKANAGEPVKNMSVMDSIENGELSAGVNIVNQLLGNPENAGENLQRLFKGGENSLAQKWLKSINEKRKELNPAFKALKEIPRVDNPNILESRKFLEEVIESLYLSKGQMVTEQDFKDLKDTLIEIGCERYNNINLENGEENSYLKLATSDISLGINLVKELMDEPQIAKQALNEMFNSGLDNWTLTHLNMSENSWGHEWVERSKPSRIAMSGIIEELKQIPKLDKSQPMGEQVFYENVVSCLLKTNRKNFTDDSYQFLTDTLRDIGCQNYEDWKTEKANAGQPVIDASSYAEAKKTGDVRYAVNFVSNLLSDSPSRTMSNLQNFVNDGGAQTWLENSKENRKGLNPVFKALNEMPKLDISQEANEKKLYENVVSYLIENKAQINTEEDFNKLKNTLLELGCKNYNDWEAEKAKTGNHVIPTRLRDAINNADITAGVSFIHPLLTNFENAQIGLTKLTEGENNSLASKWLEKCKIQELEKNPVIKDLRRISKLDMTQEANERKFFESVISCLVKANDKIVTEEDFKNLKNTLLELGCKRYNEWEADKIKNGQPVKDSLLSDAIKNGDIAASASFVHLLLGDYDNAKYGLAKITEGKENSWASKWLEYSQIKSMQIEK